MLDVTRRHKIRGLWSDRRLRNIERAPQSKAQHEEFRVQQFSYKGVAPINTELLNAEQTPQGPGHFPTTISSGSFYAARGLVNTCLRKYVATMFSALLNTPW